MALRQNIDVLSGDFESCLLLCFPSTVRIFSIELPNVAYPHGWNLQRSARVFFLGCVTRVTSYLQCDKAAWPKPPVDIDLKLRFSIRSLYWNATFISMSTAGFCQAAWSPCTCFLTLIKGRAKTDLREPLIFNRLSVSVDRCWRIFVNNLIASHLRKPNLRNTGFILTQPVNSPLFFNLWPCLSIQWGSYPGLMMSMLMTIFQTQLLSRKKVACSAMLKFDWSTCKYELQGTIYKMIIQRARKRFVNLAKQD